MHDLPAIEVQQVAKSFRVVHQSSTLKRAALDLLRNPRRRVDRVPILHEVSFNVARGEAVGVIGRNGSGKSTILTLLAGIYRPTSGRIIVRGRIGTLLDLGAGMHPDVTAEDNAVVAAMICGLSRREAVDRLPAILRFAGLEAVADTQVKHFSSGMILRLGFSVVIQARPDVLLVDEVLAVGDEGFQQRCRASIAELRASGSTVVFVSHDLDSIAEVCDRVLWLDAGRIRLAGTAAQVLPEYRVAMRDDPVSR
ncbi:MAG: ABC transporter ATP-binding protein [Fimbriimonadaceae bacterium]|nr:ABC transporter ATP-binding protein [Fimbriimonadaceae bacterium]